MTVQVNVTSPDALLQNSGVFVNSTFCVRDGGSSDGTKGLCSDNQVQIGKNGTLSLSGTPENGADNARMPVRDAATEGYDLTGDNATLNISQQAHVSGDVHATSSSSDSYWLRNRGSSFLFCLPCSGCRVVQADITRRTTVPSPAVRERQV